MFFIIPPRITIDNYNYMQMQGIKTYSEYNYIRPGIASFLRTRHFEYALRLTKDYFNNYNVIDFGCADGPFLPSLSRYFPNVLGIDRTQVFIELAKKLITTAKLTNVELLCNSNLSIEDIKTRIVTNKYHLLYLLETIEHIGDIDNLWESKVDFIEELFGLINEKGIIVISVPNMIGIPFLAQRIGFSIIGACREPISTKDLVKAALFKNTSGLEEQWDGHHLGFNNDKFERSLKKRFDVIRKNLFFQSIYVCRRRWKE